MRAFIKKTGRSLVRFFLSAAAFGILMLALLQVALIAGFAWLNTGKGREIVEAQLNKTAGAENFKIGALFYDPVRGLTLYDFSWRDGDGEILTAGRLSVGAAFEKIFIRRLDLFVTGRDIVLHRLPASVPEESPETKRLLQAFSLPDIFFNRITVSRFAIDNITLDPSIAGQTIFLSPRLRADVALDKTATFDLILHPHVAFENPPPAPMPADVLLAGEFSPEDLRLILRNFSIRSDSYTLSAGGQGSFTQDGQIGFSVTGEYPDLTGLTRDNFKSLALSVDIQGKYASPALTLDARLETGALAEKGLRDITIHATPDLSQDVPEALAEIRTAYKDDPVTLSAVLSYASPVLTLKDLRGEAPSVSLSGEARADTASGLAEADVRITADDFSHYKELIGRELGGKLAAHLSLRPLEEKQSLSADLDLSGFQYDEIRAQKIAARIFLDDLKNPWPKDADLKVDALAFTPDLSITTASASVKAADGKSYRLSLSGRGKLPQDFSFKGGSVLSEFDGAFPSADDIGLDVFMGRSAVTLSGALTPDAADLKAAVKSLRAADLPVSLPDNLSTLSAAGDITMTGPTSAPKTDMDFNVRGFQAGKYEGLTIRAHGRHENGSFALSVGGKGTGIRTLSANAAVPLEFSLRPFRFSFDSGAALRGDAKADIDIAPVAGLFLPPVQELTGRVEASADVSGTIAEPSVKGAAAIRGGAFRDGLNGIEISAIEARTTFDDKAATVSSLSATDGEQGSLKGSGHIAFAGKGSDFKINMRNFHVPKEGLADGHVDADILLKDAEGGYTLGGDIRIADMNITIPERFQSGIPELNIVEKRKDDARHPAQSVFLDLGIAAKNQFFVRGWGLDAEFGGDLRVTGTAKKPLVDGTFNSIRGRYEEFGKRFELEKADLRFQGEMPPSPYLDIEAGTKADDVTAKILFSGPVKSPSLKFTSVPELPEDEVLSRILFGKTAANISPFQAVQLAQTLRRFSGEGGGGIDPLGMLRSVTGLDDIHVDTNDAGETSVGAGKYLTDNVYLEFEKGKAENSGAANLQIELTPSVNIETKLGQDAQGGGGIFWKHDY